MGSKCGMIVATKDKRMMMLMMMKIWDLSAILAVTVAVVVLGLNPWIQSIGKLTWIAKTSTGQQKLKLGKELGSSPRKRKIDCCKGRSAGTTGKQPWKEWMTPCSPTCFLIGQRK